MNETSIPLEKQQEIKNLFDVLANSAKPMEALKELLFLLVQTNPH